MANTVVNLNLINNSNDQNNTRYVIFQKNVATSYQETTTMAWRVIKNLGMGDNHPFTYNYNLELSAADSYGNFTPAFQAGAGTQFSMIKDSSGHVLRPSGSAASASELEVLNSLSRGSIDANCYRCGKLLASKTSIVPGQKAVFLFKPVLYIAALAQIEEGDVIDSAIVTNVNTPLDLTGVASADIVIEGSGKGPDAQGFSFILTNKKML